ncbi:LOW QUALITY PROTEIN: uncharacterized protein LOC110418852 [Herrania umbratica]|uniref:LOW QUALITY PROTEIN: uncharacterized protein LOC110418852 n=1 Tax=Herrania umbratica TaxID=108875 RepID=A0A6J1AK87_9ROSI|nr:LOW QUALITY PROTEIN: uncharacterized protein LOC110418852 [Herrania umbratica]
MWVGAIKAVFACTRGGRWRKAAKCFGVGHVTSSLFCSKSLIKQVQGHITILRNRRESIIRQSRGDIAQFLQGGLLQRALERVIQLYKDQCLLCAYDQIEQFCGCIISNISHITKQSSWHTLPIDATEAVSSLVFAASRCGELPELHLLRSLFKERYGCKFVLANVELRPGNLVNFQIKQNLCITSVPDNMKQKLINEIAKECDLPLVFQDPDLQVYEKCYSEQKAEVLDIEMQDISSDIDEHWIQLSEYEKPRNDLSCCKTLAAIPSQSCINSNGYYSSTQITKRAALVEKLEVSSTRTSLDSSTPQIYETSIVYLDDLELKKTGICENYVTKGLTVTRSTRRSVTPESRYHNSFMEDPLRRKNCKVLANGRLSLDGSLDKWKAQEGNSSGSSHVHPNLPEYENLVARLKDLKAEYR